MLNSPAWVVTAVEPKNDYTMLITFASGEKKLYNAMPLLEKAIYAPLRNLAFFLKAKVECGTVVWNDDVDIDPEYLYECGVAVGGAVSA